MVIAQDLACFLYLLHALDLFNANVEKPDAGSLQIIKSTCHGGPHQGKIDQLAGISADIGAHIQHHALAFQGRPECGHCRAFNSGHCPQAELRHCHQCAGIAGGNTEIGLARLYRFNGAPHARLPAPPTQRLAGLVVHGNGYFAMDDAGNRFETRMAGQDLADRGFIAIEAKPQFRAALMCYGSTADDHGRTVVASHCIK